MRKTLLVGVLFLGLVEFGYGAWIPAKAWLSQILLTNAWNESMENGQHYKPWPWADTWPVLKLSHEKSGTELLVLQGDSGQALAFGPGLASQSTMPGKPGNTIISAHRDTHFGFLEHVTQDDTFVIQNQQGGLYRYQITTLDIVDSKTTRLQTDTEDDRVTLVTCYPFDQVSAAGSLRYVITGILMQNQVI